ncbi:sugar ABC transporter ATP-binding protein [Ruminococcaceae bacterium OttesenSCG-928-I18]|nr:sugar ABC transporter ATP-binding protein [Ruminococcaceae bacterium OttesenSCG-928-I18]
MGEIVAELKSISKSFPGVKALDNMSIDLRKGEVHGLIGENGAGKSTLIKVLAGFYLPDEGEINICGETTTFTSTAQARECGISCVYQELTIVPDSSIIDNIFLGNYETRGRFTLARKSMAQKAKEIMASLGQEVDPYTSCRNLGMGMQQMVEIGRAIQMKSKVIILDEPTASLGEMEVKKLFQSIRRLKQQGVTFLFVSHKLEEVFELCDRVTVMRDSKHVVTKEVQDITNDQLITWMVGRSLDNLYPKVEPCRGGVALSVRGFSRIGEYKNVSFDAYKGEILGFSGLVGAGRTELFHGVFGLAKPDSGEMDIHGKSATIKSPKEAIANGLAFLTEDRKNQGLVLAFPVRWNLGMVILDKLRKGIIINRKRWAALAKDLIEQLHIRVFGDFQLAGQLSGGNQQKVVIGKWLAAEADIYIFDEPTKGIDVGAKIEVYNIMNRLVQQNKCVIMISSELTEILGICDRVIVMRHGEVMEEIGREDNHFNQEDIMKAAWGVHRYEKQ